MPRTATKEKINIDGPVSLSVDEMIANPKLLKSLAKECFSCDPYNPRHTDRSSCPECKGTGITPMIPPGFVTETMKARKARNVLTSQHYDEGDDY